MHARRLRKLAGLAAVAITMIMVASPAIGTLGGGSDLSGPTPPGHPASGPTPATVSSALAERLSMIHPTVHPRPASGVNPYLAYRSEPAPMGVADFGVSPDGNGYSYGTSTFVGTAEFTNYTTYTSRFSTSASGLQLNVVLFFTNQGTTYEYWIQDVVFDTTSGNQVDFLDNIWNFSAGSGGGVYSTSVTGNGSCSCSATTEGIYIAGAQHQPGNNVNLTSPFAIELRTFAAVRAGVPVVYFDYNDGYGWQTFDTATFPFATAVASDAFRVDGTQYNPIGIFNDAELVLGGPGGGSSTTETGGSVVLSLEYDNGHNLEVVPNAYNFGSDTAETISHAGITSGAVLNGTTPGVQVSDGSGSLGELYNSSSYARLSVGTPTLASGQLFVNGQPLAYRGGAALLSLSPGNYSLGLYNGSSLVGATNVTLDAGTSTAISIPSARFPVEVHETGLPTGTHWTVRFGGVPTTSSSPWLNLTSTNGTYPFSVDPIPGYAAPRVSSEVSVSGALLGVEVRFWPFNFTVRFTASDLPTGTPWGITLGSATGIAGPSGVSFEVPNGSYSYRVDVANAYQPSPSNGSVPVQGSGSLVQIAFTLRPAYAVGLVSPWNATVHLDGQLLTVTNGSFNLTELPGTYEFEAAAPGYFTKYLNVSLTPGNFTDVTLFLSALPSTTPTGGSHPGGSTGSGGDLLLVLAAVGFVVAAAAIAVFAARRNAPRRR